MCTMSNLRPLFTHWQGKAEENQEPISDLHFYETPPIQKTVPTVQTVPSCEAAASRSDTDEDSSFVRRDAV